MSSFVEGSQVRLKRDTQKAKAGSLGRIKVLEPNALDNEGYIAILWNGGSSVASTEWFTRPIATQWLEVLEE